MKRTHPLFTLPGFIATALLLVGLGIVVWHSGGSAFSPGGLSAQNSIQTSLGGYYSHQEFETRCSLCHAPLETTQDKLCLACHEEISQQIDDGAGTHSLVDEVYQCYRCHTEHKGPDYNILNPGLERFDHSRTGFSLVWHQVDYAAAPMDCTACHATQGGFSADLDHCSSCHSERDAAFMLKHTAQFGVNCLACHDGSDSLAKFDHAQTNFPLTGKHTALDCTQCHQDVVISGGSDKKAVFKVASTGCVSCHAEPSQHLGLFGVDCATCHTTAAWHPAAYQDQPFDHTSSTGFNLVRHTLDRNGVPITCAGCHGQDINQPVQPKCVECHAQAKDGSEFIQAHQEKYGTGCLDCHDGADRMSGFDHANFFPLDGAHGTLDCQQCHADRVFKGTPTECYRCHAEPEIHAGFFGLQCQDCHTSQAWSPAQLRSHSFPLDHGDQGTVACQTCHPSRYVENTCYGCHEHQVQEIEQKHFEEGISAADLPFCTKCHPDGRNADNEHD